MKEGGFNLGQFGSVKQTVILAQQQAAPPREKQLKLCTQALRAQAPRMS